MNLEIQDKALNTAKSKGGSFVISYITKSCGWGGIPTKYLWIEVRNDVSNLINYHITNYQGTPVYISKALNIHGKVYIYQKAKLPLIGCIFGVKGVSV